MKKTYETPSVEKVPFLYKDQVVASNVCFEMQLRKPPALGEMCSVPEYLD